MKKFLAAGVLAVILTAAASSAQAHERCPPHTYETVMWDGWYLVQNLSILPFDAITDHLSDILSAECHPRATTLIVI